MNGELVVCVCLCKYVCGVNLDIFLKVMEQTYEEILL